MSTQMTITYAEEPDLKTEDYRDILIRSTLARYRPINDYDRLNRMLRSSNIIVTARSQKALIGISRSMSDNGFICYLADLAVDSSFQKNGIGKALINRTKTIAGPDCSLILNAVPEANDYYGKIGMQPSPNAWRLPRENGY